VTDVPAPTVEAEDEATTIYRYLEAERVDSTKPKLSVSERALLNMAATLLAAGDPSKAREVSDLLDRAPRVCRPGAAPEPRLADVCRADAERDITRLSNEQLAQLEVLDAVMAGRACAVASPGLEAALALASHVRAVSGGKAKRDEGGVKKLVEAILSPMYATDQLYPSRSAELIAAQERRIEVERELERLRAQLAETPGNVVRLRSSASAAQAVSAVSPPAAPRGYLGDYPRA
jgi:hypothetical protein